MTTNVECHLDAAGLNPIAGYTDLLERHLGSDCATGARDLLADFRVPPSTPHGSRAIATLLLPDDS
jgi:hypothetical protein